MKFAFLPLVFMLGVHWSWSQNVAEKLGYPPDTKLLIIHADDLGVTHSENAASIVGMTEGCVNSGSIMVPCPWFMEIAKTAAANPAMDIGVHLTLTSEWATFKWGPVAGQSKVPSLVDRNGYFFDNVPEVAEKGDAMEVKVELTYQINMALANHIEVTHLDTHMGALLANKGFLKSYLEIGNQFQLPVLVSKELPRIEDPEIVALLQAGNQVVADRVIGASPRDFESGMDTFYKTVLTNLEPGFTVLLIHLAYDDAEMQAVTIDHPNWGAAWRQADLDFFKSAQCADLLAENKVVLLQWREIRDKIIRAK
ncbi:MAG: polysaccharide deacetylase family protein [Bacteroidota bacterium]